MENRLISMVDFVLEQDKIKYISYDDLWDKVKKYANLLKQPLQKWMFVPCGEDGGVLDAFVHHVDGVFSREYQQAKERCLFEGFELERKSKFSTWIQNKEKTIIFTDIGKVNIDGKLVETIEDLIKHNLTLTATALKQIEG